ncbi:transmembrane invasion protein [Saccharomonospora sp. CUA-673]|uniref:DoxX family protein n=1 Tax=Saccharomonospora sp. CUA-673 TaxID=1904969 RepID=UPI000969E611|nr:DoxX family protein [Saccharomonospora sp. CUA-673]OLT39969.1 transmembrane invasion protein [Saccharomonospora sp. CUA-673]
MSVPTAFDVSLLVATIGCVAVNGFEVVAKLLRAPFVVQNCAAVGIDRRWLPHLAAVEGAGVVGLVLGLAGVPLIGLAAAIGLVGFFVIAVAVHIRTRVLHNIAFPVVFLLLAAASVAHFA